MRGGEGEGRRGVARGGGPAHAAAPADRDAMAKAGAGVDAPKSELTVALHLTAESGALALARFASTMNNLHTHTRKRKRDGAGAEAEDEASVFYNQFMVEDLTRIVQFDALETVLRSAANGDATQLGSLQKAIRLVRVWLTQRGLGGALTSRGAFSNFVAIYLVASLVQRAKLFGTALPFETFRTVLFKLAHADWRVAAQTRARTRARLCAARQ